MRFLFISNLFQVRAAFRNRINTSEENLRASGLKMEKSKAENSLSVTFKATQIQFSFLHPHTARSVFDGTVTKIPA